MYSWKAKETSTKSRATAVSFGTEQSSIEHGREEYRIRAAEGETQLVICSNGTTMARPTLTKRRFRTRRPLPLCLSMGQPETNYSESLRCPLQRL
jgi:hypothetical protein